MLDYSVVKSFNKEITELANELKLVLRSSTALWNPKIPCSGEAEIRIRKISMWEEFILWEVLFKMEDCDERKILEFQMQDLYSRRKNSEDDLQYYREVVLKQPSIRRESFMNLYLMNSSFARNPREFFGKFFQVKKKLLENNLLYWWIPKPFKLAYQQRIRGYRDHGTLRPIHYPEARMVLRKGAKTLKEQIQQYENHRKLIQQTNGIVEGWIT